MGNRAVITGINNKDPKNSKEIGIYLHWNGGRDSIEAFLAYCKLQQFRDPAKDSYGWARLAQIIANFMDHGTYAIDNLPLGALSVGIDTTDNLDCDNWDHGVFLINNWEIVGRKYKKREEQNVHDLAEMLLTIDDAQPTARQLGKEYIQKQLNS